MAMNPRLLRPLATGFNPRSISGLALWLDAADGSTLFQNSDGSTPATATSDPVGYWGDKSGNGRHATQATAASRPTISGTALNGRRQLSFVSQHLRGPSSTFSGSVTAYWVGRTGQSANGAFVFADGTVDSTDALHFGWLNTQGVGVYGNGWNSGNSPRAESPLAWRSANILAGVTLSADEAIARVNGATVNTTAALTGALTQASPAQFYIGRESSNVWNNLNGNIAELLIYQPALTASQRARVERYLAARWGITLAPTATNPETLDWISRVYANGGTVSTSTANAVDAFCNAIDAAGIRDKFYRLNLFAGTGLNAALVPLYRGPTFGGTTYGNATDTNNGPFVSGDYVETNGLTSNGTTKYLNTGLATEDWDVSTGGHLAIASASAASAGRLAIGGQNAAGTHRFWLISASTNNFIGGGSTDFETRGFFGGAGGTTYTTAGSAARPGGLYVLSRTSTSRMDFYIAGEEEAFSTGSVTPTGVAEDIFVMANNGGGSAQQLGSVPCRGYSIGAGLSAAQVEDVDAAWAAVQTALGRA